MRRYIERTNEELEAIIKEETGKEAFFILVIEEENGREFYAEKEGDLITVYAGEYGDYLTEEDRERALNGDIKTIYDDGEDFPGYIEGIEDNYFKEEYKEVLTIDGRLSRAETTALILNGVLKDAEPYPVDFFEED